MRFISIALTVLVGGVACNSSYDSVSNSPAVPENASLSFATVRDQIFTPHCIQCHGTGAKINLTDYPNVKKNLADIQDAVFVKHAMPPSGPLNSSQLTFLQKWIEAGGPEGIPQDPPPAHPDPVLLANFQSIHDIIFVSRCIACHSPGHTAKLVPLDTKDDLLNSPRGLVIPGTPDESGLVIAVSRTDAKKMPPPSSGMASLTPEEIGVIRDWIKNGAQ